MIFSFFIAYRKKIFERIHLYLVNHIEMKNFPTSKKLFAYKDQNKNVEHAWFIKYWSENRNEGENPPVPTCQNRDA